MAEVGTSMATCVYIGWGFGADSVLTAEMPKPLQTAPGLWLGVGGTDSRSWPLLTANQWECDQEGHPTYGAKTKLKGHREGREEIQNLQDCIRIVQKSGIEKTTVRTFTFITKSFLFKSTYRQ